MYTGSLVALVTPMQMDGKIDEAAFINLVHWHIDAGTAGIVVAGTTGESATLTKLEIEHLLKLAIQTAQGRIPIIAGTGTNNTASTIELTRMAQDAGAQAALIVTPYYNKPTQEGLFQHYKAVSEACALPIILYNVPARTGCDLLPMTIARLAALPGIIAIKEATGKIDRAQEIMRAAPNFTIYSGDDATALHLMREGAKGVISVTANIAPAMMQKMCELALNQDYAQAEIFNQRLALLHERLFLESNPIPTKWALQHLGKIPPGIRLPLLPLANTHHSAVQEAMKTAGVSV